MADQPRKAGVYDAPGSTSTSSSQTDTGPGSGTVPTLNSLEGTSTHDKASATVERRPVCRHTDMGLDRGRRRGADHPRDDTFLIGSRTMSDVQETIIPLYEEAVSVTRRKVERGRYRIDVRVVERDQSIEQTLDRQDVEVERIAVGRVVETAPEIRQDGDVMIIPIVEEEVVLVTRLVLREEIHIRKKTTQRTEQFTVTLRSERAEITRTGVDDVVSEISGDQHD